MRPLSIMAADPLLGAALADLLAQAGRIIVPPGSDASVIIIGSGADADLCVPADRPLSLPTLLERLDRLDSVPRAATLGQHVYLAGSRELVAADGHVTPLTDREDALLAYLLDADGNAVDRDTLLEEIWRYAEGVSTHTVETHIYRLRQKLEDDPAEARLIETTPDGYRLNVTL